MASTWMSVTRIRARILWKDVCPKKRYIMKLNRHFCKSHNWENEADPSRSRSRKSIFNSNWIHSSITLTQSQHLADIFMRRGKIALVLLTVTFSSMSSLCSHPELQFGLFCELGNSHIPAPSYSKGSCVHQDSVTHLNSLWGKERKNPEALET